MAQVQPMHRQVVLYQTKRVSLADVIRQWAFNSVIGLLGMSENDRSFLDYGIDNAPIYDAFVAGLLMTRANLSQAEMADMLGINPRTVYHSLKRLESRGLIVKSTQRYKIVGKANHVPTWVVQFTQAMVDLHEDPELRAQAIEEMKDVQFLYHWKAIAHEIKNKLYSSRSKLHLFEGEQSDTEQDFGLDPA